MTWGCQSYNQQRRIKGLPYVQEFHIQHPWVSLHLYSQINYVLKYICGFILFSTDTLATINQWCYFKQQKKKMWVNITAISGAILGKPLWTGRFFLPSCLWANHAELFPHTTRSSAQHALQYSLLLSTKTRCICLLIYWKHVTSVGILVTRHYLCFSCEHCQYWN